MEPEPDAEEDADAEVEAEPDAEEVLLTDEVDAAWELEDEGDTFCATMRTSVHWSPMERS